MNKVMKHINGVMLVSLLAFNANAEKPADPELWTCDSINMEQDKRIYLVFRAKDFMMFSNEGGLLDLGTFKLIQYEGTAYFAATMEFKSGPRNVFISNIPDEKAMFMQIFWTGDSKNSDNFVCR